LNETEARAWLSYARVSFVTFIGPSARNTLKWLKKAQKSADFKKKCVENRASFVDA
jgi:hypothetical protein